MANPTYKGIHDDRGAFQRPASAFRDWISSAPGAKFPPEADRYALYITFSCPWAQRAHIVWTLKQLQPLIRRVVVSGHRTEERGWIFNGLNGTDPVDPLNGFTDMASLYRAADPAYAGRFTVPVLWDQKGKTIVNNESADIIRILATGFDSLLPEPYRESYREMHDGMVLYPTNLTSKIDELNQWIYTDINNGVYRVGLAKSQQAYEEGMDVLFAALDRLEEFLSSNGSKYLLGDRITEADIRLFPTLIRFDAAYVPIFFCNYKQIRHDYPYLHTWLRRMYWSHDDETLGAFQATTHFDLIKSGYTRLKGFSVVPRGPAENILPLEF